MRFLSHKFTRVIFQGFRGCEFRTGLRILEPGFRVGVLAAVFDLRVFWVSSLKLGIRRRV